MADTNNPIHPTGGLYRQRIDVVHDDELRNWARRLAVTPEKLQQAVDKVGNWSDDVQHELSEAWPGLRPA